MSFDAGKFFDRFMNNSNKTGETSYNKVEWKDNSEKLFTIRKYGIPDLYEQEDTDPSTIMLKYGYPDITPEPLVIYDEPNVEKYALPQPELSIEVPVVRPDEPALPETKYGIPINIEPNISPSEEPATPKPAIDTINPWRKNIIQIINNIISRLFSNRA